jgi:hypothetical protein
LEDVMTRLTAAALVLFVAVADLAAAQAQEGRADTVRFDGPVTLDRTPATPSQTPVPPVDRPPIRRRGSMVGYIDDAVVGSKLRVRFETGTENDAPDRAEFFYAKCGCYQGLPPSHPFHDPEAPGPGPGAASELDFQQAFVQGEVATSDRVSFFAELPLRWIQPQTFVPGTGDPFDSQGGIGDLRGGVKVALVSALDQVVTLQIRAFVPTGKAENGLGTNHLSVEPALLLYHQLSDRASIESQVGLWAPVGGSEGVPIAASERFSGNVFFYGIGPAVEVYRGPRVRFAPVVELVGWRVLGGFQSIGEEAAGINIVNLKLGARVSWDDSGSIYGGWGRALTEEQWYHDIVRFEFRRSF